MMIVLNAVPGDGKAQPKDMNAMYPLLQLVFYLMDKVRRFHLSREVTRSSLF